MNRRSFFRSLIAPPIVLAAETSTPPKPPCNLNVSCSLGGVPEFDANHKQIMEKLFPWLKRHNHWRVRYRIDYDHF